MAEVASAFVSLMPSARGFGSKLDSEISPAITSSGKKGGLSFGKLFAAGAALGIGAKAFSFLGDSLAEATDAAVIGSRTENVIKKMGDAAGISAKQVGDLAASISNKTGIDDEAIQSGQNLLLTFGNIKNAAGEGNDIFSQTSKLMVDMSAAMGTDAKGSAIQLGKALNDPVKGITALSRVGVSFTEGQKAQIAAMVESGNTMGAQKVILGELERQFGGAAAAMTTPAEKAKVAWGNLQEDFGTLVLPMFNKVATFFTAQGIPAIRSFASTVSSTLGPILSRVGQIITGTVIPAVTRFATFLQARVLPVVLQAGQFFVTRLIPAVVQVAQAVGAKLRPILDQLATTFRGKVLPAINDLLVKFREWQPTIQKVTLVVVKIIGKVLEFAAAVLGKVLPPVIKFAGFLIGNLVPAIGGAVSILGQIIAAFVDTGKQIASAGQAFGRFANTVDSKIRAAIGFVAAVPGKILAIFANAGTLLLGAGGRLMDGLRQGIENKIEDAVDAVKAGLSRIKDLLPGSPIKNGPLKGWNGGTPGKLLMEMLARGLKIGSKSVQAEMKSALEGLEKQLDGFKSKLSSLTSDFSSLANSVASASNPDVFGLSGKDAVTEEIDGIVTVLSPATTALEEFMGGLAGNNSNLTAMLAAFDQLNAAGASTSFLSSLFHSGNTQLATQLATAGPAAVQQASALFDQNASLAATLGGKVATNELGPKMESVRVEIAELRKDMKALLPLIAKDVEKGAEKGTRAGNDDRNKDTKQRERAGR